MSDWLTAWESALKGASGWMAGAMEMQKATLTATTRQLELAANSYARLWGLPRQEVLPEDRRFKHEAWRENTALDLMKQSYLITAQWLVDIADGLEPVDPRLHKSTSFWTKQIAAAVSPTNFPLTNPQVLQETIRTGGLNLVRGMENLLADLQTGRIRQVESGSFEVGKDLAVTPGKVVYRNPLIEIIQYSPCTETVHETPILVIPPWINRYYVMDMSPGNSMYKYLVEKGFTLFTISWKNPDPSILHLEWDDYMELGPLEALAVVKEITGSDEVSTVGYCLGGIAQQVALAYISALDAETKESLGLPEVISASYFATHQDFTMVGDIDVFLSEPQVRFMEWLMEVSGGYLDGRNMAWTFNMLRSNDLLWHYVVHNYLLGQEPPAFDLLYWNSDGTRVPGKVHSYLLREFFLKNGLKDPGGIRVRGIDIDTRKITIPSYAVVGNSDHIVPWQGAFDIRQMQGGPVRFILGESGHIAGIINHPSRNKRAYWTNESDTSDPEEWLAGAEHHAGSWWNDWSPWLAERSGKRVAPPAMGSEEHPPIMDAPGTYVLEQ